MENARNFIGKQTSARVDRPMGSRHPEHGFIYPVNYGYIPGVLAPDGEELDAYILGVFEQVETFEGVCIAVIHRLDDDDDKLVLAPPGVFYSDDQILAMVEFQERFFQPVIFRGVTNHAAASLVS
jgi:inorganic pyrophosphatase